MMEENINNKAEEEKKQDEQETTNKKKLKIEDIIIRVSAIIVVISLVAGLCYWKRDNINQFFNKRQSVAKVEETQIKESQVSETISETQAEVEETIRNDKIELAEIDKEEIKEVLFNEDEDASDIYLLIVAKLKFQLKNDGFESNIGVATSIENDKYNATGIYYYDDEMNLFDDSSIKAVGFLGISKDKSENTDIINEKSLIVVKPLNDIDEDKQLICSYSYNDILPSHFVYKGKYITYYLQSEMNVVYSVLDNKIENYNLSFGNLYDYDNNELIYDENILSAYQLHTGEKLFSEEDYKELEKQLKQLSLEQEKNGYKVSNFSIVYISPENIRAYLDGKEKDTFFGYNVEELTKTLGAGNALQYIENEGLQLAKVVAENNGEVDWQSVLTKVGIGSGIIIVGAVLTPITGGASFGCALVTIAQGTITASLCAGLGSLAINTTKGMIEGKDFKQAIIGSKNKSLNTFANTFLITSAICSVGVVSGIIKPTACFVSGTKITTYDINENKYAFKNIEDIIVGDYVLSYNFELDKYENKKVINTFSKGIDVLQEIKTENETILTTPEHFFYSNSDEIWKQSKELKENEKIKAYSFDNTIISNDKKKLNTKIKVFNLEVEDNHNYYITNSQILVHNMCGKYKTVESARQAGVDKAWARERKLIQEGEVSLYKWTDAQKAEILKTGKLKGYDGAHIFDVGKLKNTVNEHLISNPDNIALVTHEEHIYWLHQGSPNNATSLDRLVELLPWMQERIELLQSMIVIG